MSRVKNDANLLLRVRQIKMSRVKNDTYLLLRVRQDKKIRVTNCIRPFAKSKTRLEKQSKE